MSPSWMCLRWLKSSRNAPLRPTELMLGSCPFNVVTYIVRDGGLGVRGQDVQSLPQRIHLLLVIRNDNCLDDGADIVVAELGLEVASLAAGRGAPLRRDGTQGLGARQRSRAPAALAREPQLAQGPLAHLLQALGEVDDGPAGAEREDEDEEVDQQAVVGEDDGPIPSSSHGRGRRVGLDVLMVLPLVGVLGRGRLLRDDPVAQGEQGDHGEAARAARRPGEDGHDRRQVNRRVLTDETEDDGDETKGPRGGAPAEG